MKIYLSLANMSEDEGEIGRLKERMWVLCRITKDLPGFYIGELASSNTIIFFSLLWCNLQTEACKRGPTCMLCSRREPRNSRF